MGSGTHCSNIDGFLGTHGTHANGATVIDDSWILAVSNYDFGDVFHGQKIPQSEMTVQ